MLYKPSNENRPTYEEITKKLDNNENPTYNELSKQLDLEYQKKLEEAKNEVIEHPKIRMLTTDVVKEFNKKYGTSIDYNELLLEVASNEQYKRQCLNLAIPIYNKISWYTSYAEKQDFNFEGLNGFQEIEEYIINNEPNKDNLVFTP